MSRGLLLLPPPVFDGVRWIQSYHRVWEVLEEMSRIYLELLQLKEPIPGS
jgi:hypothetical protein